MTLPFAAFAALVGMAHARLLAHATVGSHGLLGWLARCLAVGLTLLLAARAGELPSAALGWFAGFVFASLFSYRSLP